MKTIENLDTECLSNAIEQALDDLKKVEKSPYFEVDMREWVEAVGVISVDNGKPVAKCSVCFAGAVISQNTDQYDSDTCPEAFEKDVRETLYALDSIRAYEYADMLKNFYPDDDVDQEVLDELILLNLDEFEYDASPVAFKQNMKKIIKCLRSFGM